MADELRNTGYFGSIWGAKIIVSKVTPSNKRLKVKILGQNLIQVGPLGWCRKITVISWDSNIKKYICEEQTSLQTPTLCNISYYKIKKDWHKPPMVPSNTISYLTINQINGIL
jgi:hypothetical protein